MIYCYPLRAFVNWMVLIKILEVQDKMSKIWPAERENDYVIRAGIETPRATRVAVLETTKKFRTWQTHWRNQQITRQTLILQWDNLQGKILLWLLPERQPCLLHLYAWCLYGQLQSKHDSCGFDLKLIYGLRIWSFIGNACLEYQLMTASLMCVTNFISYLYNFLNIFYPGNLC